MLRRDPVPVLPHKKSRNDANVHSVQQGPSELPSNSKSTRVTRNECVGLVTTYVTGSDRHDTQVGRAIRPFGPVDAKDAA